MGPFTRVHQLGTIPVLDSSGRAIDSVRISGRMVLPLSIAMPTGDATQPPQRYFLSLALGELVYLHEQVPVT